MTARDAGRAAAQSLLRTDPLSTDSINLIADAVMGAYAPGHRVEVLDEKAARLEAEQRAAGTEPPAALIRRAADRLDEALAAMPRGPRRLEYQTRKGTDTVVQIDLHGPPRPGSNVPMFKAYHPGMRAEAEYAVATQPDVMHGVVGLLRAVAAAVDGMPNAERWNVAMAAIRVARTILGEAW